LWKHLTTWNVLEFKGPTVSPRRGDLIRLLELGLGIHRRLNEDRVRQRRPRVAADEVSFWYLAQHLGRRFLQSARTELDAPIEACEPGVWRCRVLRHLVYLVSGVDRPVERDSLPFHVLSRESKATEVAVARLVGAEPPLWNVYGPWVADFHPAAWEALQVMARTKERDFLPNWKLVIERLGAAELVNQIGVKQLIEAAGPKKVVKELGLDEILAQLTPTQRRELKRRLEE
jgi:hypothetical protein